MDELKRLRKEHVLIKQQEKQRQIQYSISRLEKFLISHEKSCLEYLKQSFIKHGRFDASNYHCNNYITVSADVSESDMDELKKKYPHISFSLNHYHVYNDDEYDYTDDGSCVFNNCDILNSYEFKIHPAHFHF